MDNNNEAILNASNSKADPFSYGSGHIRPNEAMEPGLVYDLNVHDYLNFLCALGYNDTQILAFSDTPYKCQPKPVSLANFNYPSITIPNFNGTVTVTRRVKNVGRPSTYNVHVNNPTGFSINVEPKVLKFDKIGQEKTFSVTIKGTESQPKNKKYVFGDLVWFDSYQHKVRSVVVVKSEH